MQIIAALAVLAASTPSPGAVRLAVPGLTSPTVKAEQLTFYTEHLAQQLASHGLEVVTSKDINSLLSMERAKQLMGCESEVSGCIAELANALGADAVVNGEIAQIGSGFQVNLRVIAAADGKRLGGYSERASSEEAVIDHLNSAAAGLAQSVLASLRPAQVQLAAASSARQGLRPAGWVGVALGALAVAFGVGALVYAQLQLAALRPTEPIPLSQAQQLHDAGKTAQTAGAVCIVAGAVFAAAGVTLVAFGSRGPSAVTLQLGTDGFGVLVRGTF